MTLACLLRGHHWLGHPPFGLTHHGPLCWRTCTRCGIASYGLGYHEQDWSWMTPVEWPTPSGLPAATPDTKETKT